MAQSQRYTRLNCVIGAAHNNLATFLGNARWCVNPNHVIADNFKIGHFYATWEFYFCSVIEPRTINGNRLVGDNFRREERFNAKSNICSTKVVVRTSYESGS